MKGTWCITCGTSTQLPMSSRQEEVDFLFVELPEGGRSIEEVRSEIAILLPRWSIAIRDSSVRESGAAAGLLGNNTRRLLN